MASEYTSTTFFKKTREQHILCNSKNKGQHKRADTINIYVEMAKSLDNENVSQEYINKILTNLVQDNK